MNGLFGLGFSSFGGAFNAIGGAVSTLFNYSAASASAAGYQSAAGGYQAAAQFALKNANYTLMKTAIKQAQATRQLEKVAGAGQAMIGHHGLVVGSGSAGDIFRDTMAQGGLAKSLIGTQGFIDAESYRAQAAMYIAQERQMMMAAASSKSSGFGSLLGAGISLLALL